MNRRLLLLSLLFCSFINSHAQPAGPVAFAQYAQKQDSMMTKCYYDRKPDNFLKLLADFRARYEKLSKEDKVGYREMYYNAYYNLSCTYAVMHDKMKAIDYLDSAVKAGYTDYAHLTSDSDLDELRKEERYLKLTGYLRQVADFRYILQRGASYNREEKRELPGFSYQTPLDPHLVSLRKAFNLDSIAGSGSEASRIINLMHWIHYLIPHDGSHGNPEVMNAMNMIAVCRSEKRGLNCRGLATVLNECYLALGFHSRFITCLPKDSLGTDFDCHVINMVWSNDLKKWLWMDPTNDAYVMNEKGELLSIQEVRERVISGAPVILNPDANWNRRSTQTVGNYLYQYMAKNLYLLECPLSSEYDTETRQAGKVLSYMQLIPLDYFKHSLDKSSETNPANKTTFDIYRTNNPDVFWQSPVQAGK
jgi:hypothetical protein